MTALLLFLLHVADSTTAIMVREGERVVTVPIVFIGHGPMVRGDVVFPPLGATFMREGRDHFTIDAGGTRIELTLELTVARIGTQVVPLTASPVERSGVVYVPLGLVTDVMPRYVPGYTFDPQRFEVRHFVPTISAGPASLLVPDPRRSAPTRSGSSQSSGRDRGWTVVVDAGHGGPDRGMKGPAGAAKRVEEADVTLAIAKRLGDALQGRGVRVVMTRSTDTLIALPDRGAIANRAGADLFLSIHVNAANPRWRDPRSARGFETYFLSEAKTDDEKRVAEMENESAKFDLDVDAQAGDPLSYLLADMTQNEDLRESSQLAETIQRALAGVRPPGLDRGVKQAGFKVLVTAHMPAVLVEVGFGTNPSEATYISSLSGQKQLAAAIANATMEYLAQYTQRRSSTGSSPR
jgi:N-acetylmuramoyl-L-alanine amidase